MERSSGQQTEEQESFYFIKSGEIEGIKYSIAHNYGEEYAIISGYADDYTGDQEVLVLPDEIDGYPVRKVTAYAFIGNEQLKSVTFPESISQINVRAFYACTALTEVNFPESYVYIVGDAFGETPYLEEQFDENGMFIRYGLLISAKKRRAMLCYPVKFGMSRLARSRTIRRSRPLFCLKE